MIRKALFSFPFQLASCAVLSLVLALIWFLAMTEERSLLHDQSGKIQEAQQARDNTEKRSKDLEQLLEKHRENMKQIQYVRDVYLRQKDERIVAISKAIAELAQTHEIHLDQVKYSVSRSRNKDLDMYRATFPLMGRYRDIRRFIHAIENSDLFVMITQLEAQESQNFRDAVFANLTLATYFEGGAK